METKYSIKSLLSKGSSNAKLAKNEKLGFSESYILYLAPFNQNNKGRNLCAKASKACAAACLFSAGRGRFNSVKQARINKANYFVSERVNFLNQLWNELEKINKKGLKTFRKIPVRLNGTSDLNWINLFKGIGKDLLNFEGIQFYDYSKVETRTEFYLNSNYHITFSRSEDNEQECIDLLKKGGNVAVVFRNKLPETWNGYKVINGDESDLRFLDPRNVVVGLKAKGAAKKDTAGFVVD